MGRVIGAVSAGDSGTSGPNRTPAVDPLADDLDLAHDHQLRTQPLRQRLVVRCVRPTGFSTTDSAPARRAFIEIFRSSASTLADTTTIGVGRSRHDPLRRLEAVHARQADVHRDHVRGGPVQQPQRLLGRSTDGRPPPAAGRRRSGARRSSRTTAESSTIMTRILLIGSGSQDLAIVPAAPRGRTSASRCTRPPPGPGRAPGPRAFHRLTTITGIRGEPRVLLHLLQQAEAVQPRHLDVGDDQVGRLGRSWSAPPCRPRPAARGSRAPPGCSSPASASSANRPRPGPSARRVRRGPPSATASARPARRRRSRPAAAGLSTRTTSRPRAGCRRPSAGTARPAASRSLISASRSASSASTATASAGARHRSTTGSGCRLPRPLVRQCPAAAPGLAAAPARPQSSSIGRPSTARFAA